MVNPFYVDTTGAWVLGHNQAQHAGTYLQAGLRGELIASPITKALSTFSGRIAGQTMQYMFRGNTEALLNYVAFRPYAMMEAIRIALGTTLNDKTMLDPVSGFSPIYYWLARELNAVNFVEIDTPKLISAKKIALKSMKMPHNLTFIPIDLAEVNLHTIYDEKVDVITVNGAYVPHTDYRDMLKYVTALVKDDGYIIAPFPYQPGIENFSENASVFSRIVTSPVGAISSEEDLMTIFGTTDFTPTHIITLSDLAEAYNKPAPMDIEVIIIAQKGISPPLEPDDDLYTMIQLNEALHESDEKVSPFIEFDPETFARFPRRKRLIPPKKLP